MGSRGQQGSAGIQWERHATLNYVDCVSGAGTDAEPSCVLLMLCNLSQARPGLARPGCRIRQTNHRDTQPMNELTMISEHKPCWTRIASLSSMLLGEAGGL